MFSYYDFEIEVIQYTSFVQALNSFFFTIQYRFIIIIITIIIFIFLLLYCWNENTSHLRLNNIYFFIKINGKFWRNHLWRKITRKKASDTIDLNVPNILFIYFICVATKKYVFFQGNFHSFKIISAPRKPVYLVNKKFHLKTEEL